MKFNRENYEASALDYLEGTLPAKERAGFERFLETHPDIAAEVRALQKEMPVLTPDLSICYEGKAALKHRVSTRLWIYRASVIAAVLVVALMVFNRFQGDTTDPVTEMPGVTPLASNDAPMPETMEQPTVPTAVLPDLAESMTQVPVKPAAASIKAASVQSHTDMAPDVTTITAPDPSQNITPEETREVYTREIITVPDLVADHMERSLDLPGDELPVVSDNTLYTSNEVVIEQVEEFVVESTETEHFYAEELPENRRGMLNLFSKKGLRKLASSIIAPLSEISPVEVRNDKNERVVEFASIPISRRSNKLEE